jgi:hypothetical protein
MFVTLVTPLGIVQAGGRAMADRFTYLTKPRTIPDRVGWQLRRVSVGISDMGKWRPMAKLFQL